MKILWFTNSILSDNPRKATGTWLQTMNDALREQGIEVAIITQSLGVRDVTRKDFCGQKQWVLPVYKLHNGLPSSEHIVTIQKIVEEVSPDIIHIWGTEKYWGLLTARNYIRGNVLLEIEGLMFSCVDVFYGGLSFNDLVKAFGMKELLMPSRSLFGQKREFREWGKYELEMIAAHRNISTQSDWVRNYLSFYVSPDCRIYNTGIIVRDSFFSGKWIKKEKEYPVIFSMASGALSYKGIHNAIKAFSLVKKKYPKAVMKIAGSYGLTYKFYKKPGYTKYLQKLINELSLEDCIYFTGSLDASGLVQELLNCDVMIQSSYVESYSLALAESMALGVPCVVAYSGAMPELAKDQETALFYPCQDYVSCAANVCKLLSDDSLCRRISTKASEIGNSRNKAESVVRTQIEIYKQLMDHGYSNHR